MRHRFELDGVRALAVTAVVLSHASIPFLAGGWIGVDVFFVLSGYLITSILVGEWDRTGCIGIRRFYAKRALRLYPALLLMLLLGTFCFHYLGDHGTLSGYFRSASFAGLYIENFVVGFSGDAHGNLGHTFTLAMEEQFYLLWAPCLVLLLRRGLSPVLWLVDGIVLSWASLVLTSSTNLLVPLTYYRPDTRVNELLLGCLLAMVMRSHATTLRSLPLVRSFLAPLSLLGLVGLGLFAAHTRQYLYALEEPAAGLLSVGLLMGLATASDRAPLTLVLRSPPLVALGRISYGVYLFFVPVLAVLPHVIPSGWNLHYWQLLVLELATIAGLATASHLLVERRFLALKDRLSKTDEGMRPGRATPIAGLPGAAAAQPIVP